MENFVKDCESKKKLVNAGWFSSTKKHLRIQDMLDNGADHIWVEGNQVVNLVGTPWSNLGFSTGTLNGSKAIAWTNHERNSCSFNFCSNL